MDENKWGMLKEDYVIYPTCGLCKHADIDIDNTDWGTCKIRTYRHNKHSDSERQLSIYASGGCSQFEPSESRVHLLGRWSELLVKDASCRTGL